MSFSDSSVASLLQTLYTAISLCSMACDTVPMLLCENIHYLAQTLFCLRQ